MKKLIFLLLTVTICTVAAPIVNNGSFENPTSGQIPGFQRLFSVNNSITGWTVSAGDVDWIGTLWQPSEGARSLDMTGNNPGTIFQDVAGFVLGQSYDLIFDIAGNPFTSQVKRLRVAVISGSNTVATSDYSFTQAGNTLTSMGWEQRTLSFTSPVSGSLRLQFSGLNADGSGPALDNVRLGDAGSQSSIPEPATFALFGSSILLLGALRRK